MTLIGCRRSTVTRTENGVGNSQTMSLRQDSSPRIRVGERKSDQQYQFVDGATVWRYHGTPTFWNRGMISVIFTLSTQ